MTIGEKIKYIRQLHGISQKEMGDICDVSPAAVSSWEQGRNDPRPRMLNKIAQHFNIPLDTLLHPQDGLRFEEALQRTTNNLEETMLDKYRQLSPLGQETVNAVIDTQLRGQRNLSTSGLFESGKLYGHHISPEIRQELERYLHYLLNKESSKNKDEK